MPITLRPYHPRDLDAMNALWNDVVEKGEAFPQENLLNLETGKVFFAEQSATTVAERDGQILGLYILHPNNVGRCSHIANASYCVDKKARNQHIGEALVKHSLETAKSLGFRLLQFNAVVATNHGALHLYERLGFHRLGTIPGGFRMKDGHFEDIILFYISLDER